MSSATFIFTHTTPLIVSLRDTIVFCVVKRYTSSPVLTYASLTHPNVVICRSIINVDGTLNTKFVHIVTSRALYWNISMILPFPPTVSAVVKLKKNGLPGNHPV